jgi:hypothetical protein
MPRIRGTLKIGEVFAECVKKYFDLLGRESSVFSLVVRLPAEPWKIFEGRKQTQKELIFDASILCELCNTAIVSSRAKFIFV